MVSEAQDIWDGDDLECVGVIWDAHELLFQQSAEVQVLQFILSGQIYSGLLDRFIL